MFRQTVLFEGHNASGFDELWVTNGTAPGTYELTTAAGAGFTEFNGEVFYSAGGLWVTDGTAAGTSELTGISGASVALEPANLTVLSSLTQAPTLFFSGFDSDNSYGLWVTNGTAGGTIELGGVDASGISGANHVVGLAPAYLITLNRHLLPSEVLFRGYDASDALGLWVTNGTAAGTHELTGISDATSNGVDFADPISFNREILFEGVDAGFTYGLWVTNGTAVGTTEIGGLGSTGIAGASSKGLDPTDMTLFNGEVIFDGTNSFGVASLWLTNGTAAGTEEIVGIGGAAAGGLFPPPALPRNSSPTTARCCSKESMQAGIPACGSPMGQRAAPRS